MLNGDEAWVPAVGLSGPNHISISETYHIIEGLEVNPS